MNVTIEKIEITAFGKLKNTVVKANEGLNILSAPNESGKTTLAAFIRFVFYGFVNGRAQTLSENDKKLYLPWGGEAIEGSITLTADGKRYTVSRICTPSGKESVEIINRTTGSSEFSGAVPGEVFFGVGEDVFSRTLFFRQLTLPQNKDDIVAQRLQNIAISADEQVGSEKAKEKLKKCKNELVGKAGNGIIPKMIAERDAIEETLSLTSGTRNEVNRLREEIKIKRANLEKAEANLASLEKERENIEKYDALLRLTNINRLLKEEELLREEYESAASVFKDTDGVDVSRLAELNTRLVVEQQKLRSLQDSLKNAEEKKSALLSQRPFTYAEGKAVMAMYEGNRKKGVLFLALAGVAAVAGVALTALAGMVGASVFGVAAAFAVVGAVFMGKNPASKYGFAKMKDFIIALSRSEETERALAQEDKGITAIRESVAAQEKDISELENSLKSAIDACLKEAEGENYSAQIEAIRTYLSESEKCRALWQAKKDELDNTLQGIDVEQLAEKAKGATEPQRDRIIVEQGIRLCNSQISMLTEQINAQEITCASLDARCGDLSTLVGKRDALDGRIAELKIKHSAYETAMKYIEEASNDMKGMVAPRIANRAELYFAVATGGKYSKLELDTHLSMTVGEDFSKSCEYLSAGTRDSAYIALRLALTDILYNGASMPMVLDDAFVRMDDERLMMMAKALGAASAKHQIFIFTHGEREINAFTSAGVNFSRITLNN